MQYCWQKT